MQGKDALIQQKDVVIKSKEEITNLLNYNLQVSNSKCLELSSWAKPVMANSILLWSVLNCRFSKSGTNTLTFKTMMNTFIQSDIMENSALLQESLQYLKNLAKFGLCAKEGNLLKLFSKFAFQTSCPSSTITALIQWAADCHQGFAWEVTSSLLQLLPYACCSCKKLRTHSKNCFSLIWLACQSAGSFLEQCRC